MQHTYLPSYVFQVTEVSAADMVGEAYNPQTALYQITLYTCALALIVLSLCGCVYEIIRRKRISVKVDCEKGMVFRVFSHECK